MTVHRLPTSLRRAGELELERSVRSGRGFSLILFRIRADARSPRARRRTHRRLRLVAGQHLRPFDTVDVAPTRGILGIVAHDADGSSAATIGDRISSTLAEAGGAVLAIGVATYPEDGLLLTHVVDRAMERLDGTGPADASGVRTADLARTLSGGHR